MEARRQIIPAIAVAVICSCDGADETALDVAVADSSGVEIVTAAAAAWPVDEWWTVEPHAIVRIGGADGTEPDVFGRVGGGRILSRGQFAIVDQIARSVRIYDQQGAHVNSFGRRGDGPGEFRSINGLEVLSDNSLVAVDVNLMRSTAFSVQGQLIKTTQLVNVPRGYVRGRVMEGRGFVLQTPNRLTGFTPGQLSRDTVILDLYNWSGERSTTIAHIPGVLSYGWKGPGVVPFTPEPTFAVTDSSVLASSGDAYEYREFTTNGRLRRIVRLRRTAFKVTDAMLESWRKPVLKEAEAASAPQEVIDDLVKYMRAVPVPEHTPAVNNIVVDGEGYIWLRHYPSADSASVWSIFSPTHRYQGDIRVPRGIRVLDIRQNLLLGVMGEDDVPTVVLHRVSGRTH